jgi:hypothetical protein
MKVKVNIFVLVCELSLSLGANRAAADEAARDLGRTFGNAMNGMSNRG